MKEDAQPPIAPPAAPALRPDPLAMAEQEVLARMRELLKLLAASDDKRSLLLLRQWAKLTSEAERVASARKPRVAGQIGQIMGGRQYQMPGFDMVDNDPAVAGIGGVGVDDGGLEPNEDGLAAPLPFGGDQGNLMRGMIHEVKEMNKGNTAQNEAKEIDALVGATRMLSHAKSPKTKKGAELLEGRLLALIEKKIEDVESRFKLPPEGVPVVPARNGRVVP